MLHDDAMIVRLNISQWTARKYDKSISKRVADEYGTRIDVGRYNKVLIARDALKKITSAASAARAYHYENTLPWDDGGGRLLPAANFMNYSQMMRALKTEFDSAVEEFIGNYETYRQEAELRLSGMFNRADYPGQNEIVGKFGFKTDFEPVPKSSDFRVTLQKKDADRIRQQIDERVQERLKDATTDLFYRLSGVLKRMVEKLKDDDAIFRDSLVENVVELVNLMPRLNVENDEKLNEVVKDTRKKLCTLEPDTLRKDTDVRSQAAGDAEEILKKMNGYLKVRK